MICLSDEASIVKATKLYCERSEKVFRGRHRESIVTTLEKGITRAKLMKRLSNANSEEKEESEQIQLTAQERKALRKIPEIVRTVAERENARNLLPWLRNCNSI